MKTPAKSAADDSSEVATRPSAERRGTATRGEAERVRRKSGEEPSGRRCEDVAHGTSRTKNRDAQRPADKKSLSPTVMWLMTLGAMLLVSAIALLVFYYLIVAFTKMGNFLDLPAARPAAESKTDRPARPAPCECAMRRDASFQSPACEPIARRSRGHVR